MDKRIIMLLVALSLMIQTTSALQQTVGELKTNVTSGNSTLLQYGIKNEENMSVNVSFNIEGKVANFTSFNSNIILEPNEFRKVNLTVTIPQNQSIGLINGTIYALKEGSRNGQVQLNIRLGKYIKVYVEEPQKPISTKKSGYDFFITVTGIFITIYAMIKYKNNRRNK